MRKGTACGSGSGSKKVGVKRGPWTGEEDEALRRYIEKEGEGRWRTLPKRAGLMRCGKSCRLRWMNYLRPCVKRGHIAPDEEDLILRLHRLLGNRWSLIAGRIPGRTDNEIKNYWNTHLSKKLIRQGIDPRTHKPLSSTPPPPPPNPTTNPPPHDQKKPPTAAAAAAIASSSSSKEEKEEDHHMMMMMMMMDPYSTTTTHSPALEPYDPPPPPPPPPSIPFPTTPPISTSTTPTPNDTDNDNDNDDDVFSSFLNSLINDNHIHNHNHNDDPFSLPPPPTSQC